MADIETEITPCGNFLWVIGLNYVFDKTAWSLNYICIKQSNKWLLLTMG